MKLPINIQERPLSYSSMKHFRKSPKHYIQYITSPREYKPEWAVGSGFELKLYSHVYGKPEMFDGGIFPYVKPNLRSNAGKEEWEQLKKQAQGKIMLDQDQLKKIEAMMENTLACDAMMQYVDSIKKDQIKLKWTDRKTGIPFIGYADAEGDAFGEDWVFEIKTSKSADPGEFVRDFFKFDYHMQIASYSEGYHKLKYKFPNFAVLVFETSEPYNCSPFMIEGRDLEKFKEEWRASVDAFKFCCDNELFHQGYDFLLQTMDYFALRQPGYYKPRFGAQ